MSNKLSKLHPFIKWAGGKTQIINELSKFIPPNFSNYHEPFLGGGAFFFFLASNQKIKKAYLSDLNKELIETYLVVKESPLDLASVLAQLPITKEFYYKIRSLDPNKLTPIERAARFIYLNKTCYNGLYRVNSQGKFNVPFGRYKKPKIFDLHNLLEVSKALHNAELFCADFEIVLSKAQSNDLVYFDPPYFPISKTANFTTYLSSGFDERDQIRLKEVVLELTNRDVFVILSNSYCDFILNLYKDSKFFIIPISARRSINCKGESRKGVKELIVVNATLKEALEDFVSRSTLFPYMLRACSKQQLEPSNLL